MAGIQYNFSAQNRNRSNLVHFQETSESRFSELDELEWLTRMFSAPDDVDSIVEKQGLHLLTPNAVPGQDGVTILGAARLPLCLWPEKSGYNHASLNLDVTAQLLQPEILPTAQKAP